MYSLSERIVDYIRKSICSDLHMRCASTLVTAISLFDGRVEIAISHHRDVNSWAMNTILPKVRFSGTTFAEFVVALRAYLDTLQEGPVTPLVIPAGRHLGKTALGMIYGVIPMFPTVKKTLPKPESNKAKGYQPPAQYAARSARGGFRPEYRRL
jgi:hypothetical protein